MDITNKKQASKAIEVIAENDAILAEVETELNEAIVVLRKKFTRRTEALISETKELKEKIEEYAQNDRKNLFGKSKSVSLPAGSIGFRKSSSLGLTTAKDWDAVLDTCFDKKLDDLIVENFSVNKAAVKGRPDLYSDLGIGMIDKETFWVKTLSSK